jgi:hypothetical protein
MQAWLQMGIWLHNAFTVPATWLKEKLNSCAQVFGQLQKREQRALAG